MWPRMGCGARVSERPPSGGRLEIKFRILTSNCRMSPCVANGSLWLRTNSGPRPPAHLKEPPCAECAGSALVAQRSPMRHGRVTVGADTQPPLGAGVGARHEQESAELRARSLSGRARDLSALVPESQQEPAAARGLPRALPFPGAGGGVLFTSVK